MFNFKFDFKGVKQLFSKGKIIGASGEPMNRQTGKFEINLVPDVKLEMIKMQKIRNLVFFICIVIASTAVGAAVILGGITGAQELISSNQDKKIKLMYDKISGYGELKEFLTVQDQLGKLEKIDDKKKVLSRVFSILSVILPKGKDTISLSELNVSLDNSSLNFDAQANAGVEPLIDYRVLESFMKGVALMKYDYGRYVDADGREIPTRCIVETSEDGSLLNDNGSIYAIWQRGKKGCDPGRDDLESLDKGLDKGEEEVKKEEQENKEKLVKVFPDEKIWRTPQFKQWYEGKEVKTAEDGIDDGEVGEENGVKRKKVEPTYKPTMSLGGVVSGVPHFVSKCINYSGADNGKVVKWTAENSCDIAKNGVKINDSSNGRDASGNLVLRFSAVIILDPNVFAFKNKHVMAIGPNGQNVTDSYIQIEGMFAERAKDCVVGDAACKEQRR